MPTTTIRLPEDLKIRVAEAARRAGTTTHAFILAAIAEKAEQEERHGDFDQLAEDRYARIAASGETISWQETRAFLEERLAGKAVPAPTPRQRLR
ncbi:MAG: Ribbon-helix-helix protein, copG family [Candidatus Accumulibacter appositus]|uniref:Ribbon-helix-helix protein, copG family n=1 Tax=Candidatus Accumulibacter appositus TaxID=1454003 RepID=A0A011QX00_9PROT|nr:CopG family transcriptional regulator [Accumulibacter sp.]EXI83379.1 MAG: Ribbon-helix-helix protein, copG family [Candidatus Accumulibacter appositus]HRF06894.1 CopG family transcriptional regulator [Accumulibacter sp.]